MNQYDPNQQMPPGQQPPYSQTPPQQTPYPPYQQQQVYEQQQPYQQPVARSSMRNPLQQISDRLGVSAGVLIAAALLLVTCLCGGCVLLLVFLAGGRVPPPTPPPTPAPTFDMTLLTPVNPIAGTPTFNPVFAGTALNPYIQGRMDLATAIYVDVLNPDLANQFERKAQIFPGSAEFDTAMTAFNVGNLVTAPDTACIDRVRLEIPRSDGATLMIGVCLKGWGVIRSPNIGELGGGDLAMYPLFVDFLAPYLPAAYRSMLD